MKQTQNAALLVMDMQAGILCNLPDATGLIGNTAKAIANARSRKIPVIYVILGFRADAPEISPNNKSFSTSRERFTTANMEEYMGIDRALAPMAGDIIVTKRRVSAFTGSDLEVVLRAQDIRHLVLTGFSTSGIVLSTVREASDKDYRITILSDGCCDADEEVHRVLMTKVFPRQAEVVPVEEWARM